MFEYISREKRVHGLTAGLMLAYEMAYLEKLASGLGITPEVTGRIERMVGPQHV